MKGHFEGLQLLLGLHIAVASSRICLPVATDGVMPDEDAAKVSDHGWQRVVNPKRRRRLEARQESKAGKTILGPSISDSQVFQALEVQAADRRAQLRLQCNPVATAQDLNSYSGDKLRSPNDKPHPKAKKSKKAKVSPRELGAAIDPVDLSLFLDGVMESYVAMPEVQLKRFADYFGGIFHPISATEFAWDNGVHESPLEDSIEMPICYLPESVSKVACDWLACKPTEELRQFLLWLLKADGFNRPGQSIGTSMKDSKVGTLVVLALVLRTRPDVFLQHASGVQTDPELLGLSKLPLPTLVWMYGQAARGDLVIGMSLWVHKLLPLAEGKFSTPMSRHFTLQFFESALLESFKRTRGGLLNDVSKRAERLVPPAALDSLLRLAYPSESARTKATARFSAIYPIVKELCLAGSFGTKSTRPVAEQLLPLSLDAAGSDVEALSHEACLNAIWCLQQNPVCYVQWESLHLSNLNGSVAVLQLLCSTWKENFGRLSPLDDLKRTVLSFRLMHQNAIKSAEVDKQVEALCKEAELLYKLICRQSSGLRACGKATATIVVAMVLGYGFYLLSPPVNPWKWDGQILLSKTHSFF